MSGMASGMSALELGLDHESEPRAKAKFEDGERAWGQDERRDSWLDDAVGPAT